MKFIQLNDHVVEQHSSEILRSLTNGTHYVGEIQTPYVNLVSVFGLPNKKGIDNSKTDAEWLVMTPFGIATIYNYKDGKNYRGEEGMEVEEITEWHIGGHSKNVVESIERALR